MRVRDVLLDLLYPPKCPFCGALLEGGELLCPACVRDLPWLVGPGGAQAVEGTSGCVSPLRYEGAVQEAIHGYKFGGRSARSGAFGRLIAQCVLDHGLGVQVISWPPLSKKRRRARGYDQAELLALAVGRELDLPVVRTLDKAERPAQSGLTDAAARRANVLGAYSAHGAEAVRGRRVLLVDDVVTTGATLASCAQILRAAGAGEVVCATLARAR